LFKQSNRHKHVDSDSQVSLIDIQYSVICRLKSNKENKSNIFKKYGPQEEHLLSQRLNFKKIKIKNKVSNELFGQMQMASIFTN